ncbi:MAG: PilZ domain-containing protein [Syntrophales bacterium]|nr:PilZ domain-containing protein [Syntrophales bacterium]
MAEERRRRTRVPIHFDVTIQANDKPVNVETENISLNGILCRPDKKLKMGDEGDARIVLSPEVVISARVRIVRSDEEGMAIAFAGVDEESFHHLKNLVQYNTEDADIIDRELKKAGF